MSNKLELILQQKKREVALLARQIEMNHEHPVSRVMRGQIQLEKRSNFRNALQSTSLAVIAEIKRKSPSKGLIAPILDPAQLAERYIAGGASALSILTDHEFFGGNIHDLSEVANSIRNRPVPIIRKDFIIDKIQIAEAVVSGASAVLLIVAALGDKIYDLQAFAHSVNLDVLVEVHDEAELDIALACGANIIGINNRDLGTFVVDSERSLQLVKSIPSNIIKVAESGITDPLHARNYYHAGFNAVLIGEALVRSDNPEQFIEACMHV